MGSLEGKKKIVEEIKQKLSDSQSVVAVDYRGLNVSEITELRANLRAAQVEMKVYKNTLVKIAADNAGIEGLDDYLQGPNAWVFCIEDAVSGPKILKDFAKQHKALEMKAGIIENKVIDENGVKALADLPSREELLAQVVGTFQSPLVGMANVLQGPIRKFGYALEALRKEKEEA